MKSHAIIKEAVKDIGAKAVAQDMNVSASLVYKWCQETETEGASGADNPLDRLARLYELTGDVRLIEWLCWKADGFFMDNVTPGSGPDAGSVVDASQNILKEFSDVLEAVTKGMGNEGRIDCDEARVIRKEWEDLKGLTENFVRACEQGDYDPDRSESLVKES